MRPDVKLGVIFSVIGVLVGGGYFMYRDGSDASIPVGSNGTAQADPTQPDPQLVSGFDRGKTEAGSPTMPARRIVANNRMRDRTASKTAPAGAKEVERSSPTRSIPLEKPTQKPAEMPVETGPGRQVHADKANGASALTRLAEGGRRGANHDSGPLLDDGSKGAVSRATIPGQSDASSVDNNQPERLADETDSRDGRLDAAGSLRGRPASRPVSLAGVRPASSNETASKSGSVAVDTHRVRSGDTFSSLSKAYYGTVRYANFLISSNPHVRHPRSLAIGTVIKIPPRPAETLNASSPESSSRGSHPATSTSRTYRVRPGESFYAIARDQLGDASRWQELFELNKALVHDDPKKLQVGQELTLPN